MYLVWPRGLNSAGVHREEVMQHPVLRGTAAPGRRRGATVLFATPRQREEEPRCISCGHEGRNFNGCASGGGDAHPVLRKRKRQGGGEAPSFSEQHRRQREEQPSVYLVSDHLGRRVLGAAASGRRVTPPLSTDAPGRRRGAPDLFSPSPSGSVRGRLRRRRGLLAGSEWQEPCDPFVFRWPWRWLPPQPDDPNLRKCCSCTIDRISMLLCSNRMDRHDDLHANEVMSRNPLIYLTMASGFACFLCVFSAV